MATNTYPEPYRSSALDSLVDPSGCYSRECTSYCAWKVKEATGKWLKHTGDFNAKNWVARLRENGYKTIVSTPVGNGKCVGVCGAHKNSTGAYGHVLWADNSLYISEYNYPWPFYRAKYHERNVKAGDWTWVQIVAPKKKKSVAEVAQEVLDGKWGNGNVRKQRLTQAGFNYNEVQAKVNALVAGRNKGPSIGCKVKTSAKTDVNGVRLNTAIINDGQSVWKKSQGSNAILYKGNTVRCVVPISTLRRA
jgi:surface antigen